MWWCVLTHGRPCHVIFPSCVHRMHGIYEWYQSSKIWKIRICHGNDGDNAYENDHRRIHSDGSGLLNDLNCGCRGCLQHTLVPWSGLKRFWLDFQLFSPSIISTHYIQFLTWTIYRIIQQKSIQTLCQNLWLLDQNWLWYNVQYLSVLLSLQTWK